jgi:hypothetical protein
MFDSSLGGFAGQKHEWNKSATIDKGLVFTCLFIEILNETAANLSHFVIMISMQCTDMSVP